MKILIIPFILLLAACHTTKYIDRVETKVDSTAIRKVDSLIEVKRTDSANYNAMIQALSEQQIQFRDTGRTVTEIQYYPDGQLKYVKGEVRSLSTKLANTSQVASFWRSKYDSLASHQDTSATEVAKNVVTVTKEVKRSFIPFWVWLIMAGVAVFCLWSGKKLRNVF